MAVEEGIVVKVFSDNVLIKAKPASGCSSCKVKKQCAMSGDGKIRYIKAQNKLSLEVGDNVLFKIEEKGIIISSLLLYLLPVVLLLTGVVLGNRFYYLLGIKHDIAEIIGGIAGFGLSFLFIFFITKLLQNKKIFRPVVCRKL